MALRANDADDNKSWLAICNEDLKIDVAAKIESEWIVLFEESREPNSVITGLTTNTGSSPIQQHTY